MLCPGLFMPRKSKTKLLNRKINFKSPATIITLLLVAAIGGFFVYQSLASSTSFWGEESGTSSSCSSRHIVCNHGGSRVSASGASGGYAYKATSNTGPYYWPWFGPYLSWNVSYDYNTRHMHKYVVEFRFKFLSKGSFWTQVSAFNGKNDMTEAADKQSYTCDSASAADWNTMKFVFDLNSEVHRSGRGVAFYCGTSGVSYQPYNWLLAGINDGIEFRAKVLSGTVLIDRVRWYEQ